MNNFLEASRVALRVSTIKGVLSVEQLWQLPLTQLAASIKEVKKSLVKDNDDDLSFLSETTVVNKIDQLRFDILKEIYLTKKSEAEEAKTKQETKEHNEKIMKFIYEKQEKSLGDKSIEELEKLLK